jgi:hypothetical protein
VSNQSHILKPLSAVCYLFRGHHRFLFFLGNYLSYYEAITVEYFVQVLVAAYWDVLNDIPGEVLLYVALQSSFPFEDL